MPEKKLSEKNCDAEPYFFITKISHTKTYSVNVIVILCTNINKFILIIICNIGKLVQKALKYN